MYLTLIDVTLPIGWLLSNLLLRVMYYGIMTPAGLLSRLFGRDPLGRKRPEGGTYWLERRPREDAESYFRQT